MAQVPNRDIRNTVWMSRFKNGTTRTLPHLFALLLGILSLASVAVPTYSLWTERETKTRLNQLQKASELHWLVEAPGRPWTPFYARAKDTRYWGAHSLLKVRTGTEVIATQGPVTISAEGSLSPLLTMLPGARVLITRNEAQWISGSGSAPTPIAVRLPGQNAASPVQGWILFDGLQYRTDGFFLSPKPGSDIVTSNTASVQFQTEQSITAPDTFLELATDSSFQSVVMTEPWAPTPQQGHLVNFADRSPGTYFARLVDRGHTVVHAVSVFHVMRFSEPHGLRSLGRRFMTFDDESEAIRYRIEFSTSERFESLVQSRQTQSRLIDLLGLIPGAQFARVVSIHPGGREVRGLPLHLVVPTEKELRQARSDLADPNLEMLAKGWRVMLNENEMLRLRDGYVILHESELRGIRSKNNLAPDRFIFELSRDPSFANPERVKPDSRGELLPPALPVGTLFARLRALESDGSLGATGAVSRLTTLLPAPKTEQAQPTLVQERSGYELRWSLPVDVPGYELRLSSNDQFPDEQTHVIRTKSLWRKVAPQSDGAFYWTIQAINEFGQPMSARSSVQTVAPRPALKPLAQKTPTTPRAPANIPRPQLEPMLPAEDAIVVGGATARRYGALKWEGDLRNKERFQLEVATDRDFVNVVIKSKTKKNEFTLEGDLPEGALFWRVKRTSDTDWSTSRRFELIYE